MSETLKFGNGEFATKKGSTLAYNDTNGNFKPLPFTFDRSTSATRVNKEGLIEVVSNNEPRIDFLNDSKGALLLEPSRSNLVTYSEDFSGWNGAQFTTPNYAISPDGTQNASRLLFTGASQVLLKTTSLASGVSCSATFYVKGNAGETIQLAAGGIDTMHTLNGSWQRLETNQTSANSTILLNTFGGSTARDLLIWGAQLEQGSYATSYIPTQGSSVTRDSDSCLKDDINTSIINSSYPFSMYAESTYVGGNKHVLSFSKKSVSDNFYVISINDNNEVLFQARANGATELIQSGVTLVDGQKFKVAITMESATSGKICVNGNTVVSKTNFSNQAVNNQINDLLLGQLRTVTDTGNRLPITDARLYNTALTDQELINLTTI